VLPEEQLALAPLQLALERQVSLLEEVRAQRLREPQALLEQELAPALPLPSLRRQSRPRRSESVRSALR
jgi:hypothetical protein